MEARKVRVLNRVTLFVRARLQYVMNHRDILHMTISSVIYLG